MSIPILLYICNIRLRRPRFFELQFKSLFIMNFVFGFLKLEDFPSIIISHTPHILFLHLVAICVVFLPNGEKESVFKVAVNWIQNHFQKKKNDQ